MRKSRQLEEEVRDGVSSDSDAPEEESNVATRRSIKSIDKSRKAPKRSAAKPSTQPKSASGSKNESATNVASEEASSSSSTTPPSAPSHLLDPSLFAASFAKRRTSINALSTSKSTSTLNQAKPIKKRFGIAKGNDGQPMKRLKDGRTTVRVLQRDGRTKPLSEDSEIIEETLQIPPALDSSEVLPNAKIRGFRKQKLGLRDESKQVRKVSSMKKASRIEEDPLGLEDPAFMKGGELEGVGLAPKREFREKARPSPQLRGRRTKCELN